jgi:hypothetical protein
MPIRFAAIVIGLVVVGCAVPATEEGFNQAFCEADARLEVAITEITEISDREPWVEATRAALLEYRDDLDVLPAWEPARQARAELVTAVDRVLDLVESGAAGVLIETPQWENAIQTMLAARESLRAVAGPCLRV